MDRTHEAIISALHYMAAAPMEKVYQVTTQCSVSASSSSTPSSACQAALATVRAEEVETWWRETYKRNPFTELLSFMKNV